jgi:hypothetical protein
MIKNKAVEELYKRLYIFFLNGGNRDFSEKYLPTDYLNGHLNIVIFYSRFFVSQI